VLAPFFLHIQYCTTKYKLRLQCKAERDFDWWMVDPITFQKNVKIANENCCYRDLFASPSSFFPNHDGIERERLLY